MNKKIKHLICTSLFAILCMVSGWISGMHAVSAATTATLHTIPSEDLTTVNKTTAFNISSATLTEYSCCDDLYVETDTTTYEGMTHYQVYLKWDSSHQVGDKITLGYSNGKYPFEAKFENVGTINGRQINATYRVYQYILTVESDYYNNYRAGLGYQEFINFSRSSFWCYGNGIGTGKFFNKITLTYADDGSTVDVPCYQRVADLDSVQQYCSTPEGWKGTSGYTGDLYVYPSCTLDIDKDEMEAYSANQPTVGTEGDASLLETGLFASMTNGTSQWVFFENHCGTEATFYSAYQDVEDPVKTVSATSAYDGTALSYTITQKKHTFYSNTFTCYDDMSITDVLPEEVEYVSATLKDGDTDVTSKYGKLSYDDKARTVTYTIDASVLEDIDFYDGEDLTLQINVKAVNKGKTTLTAKNTATTTMSGITLSSNEVSTKIYPYFDIDTKITNGTITDNITNIPLGATTKVSWEADQGYYVTDVIVDGVSIYSGTKVSGYLTETTFKEISSDHSVVVKTAKIPYLVLTKTTDKDSYEYEDIVTYTILVEQTVEDAIATDVVITDTDVTKGLVFDLTTLTCDNKDAVVTTSDNGFTIAISSLSYGDPVKITVQGKVDNDTLESSEIKNTATALSDQTEKITDDADISIYYRVDTLVTNGTITDTGILIKRGQDCTVSYEAKEGYHLTHIIVDGEEMDIDTYAKEYILTNVKSNHVVEAVYEKDEVASSTEPSSSLTGSAVTATESPSATVEPSETPASTATAVPTATASTVDSTDDDETPTTSKDVSKNSTKESSNVKAKKSSTDTAPETGDHSHSKGAWVWLVFSGICLLCIFLIRHFADDKE